MIHWHYLRYLVRHKWHVAKECWRAGLYLHAITHDLSKFRPSEWFPYARWFYGKWPSTEEAARQCPGYPHSRTQEGVRAAFDHAWLLHQKRNKHHWQYYVLMNDMDDDTVLRMPTRIVKQMACDWQGASKAIRGKDAKARDWYMKVKDKTRLHPSSRLEFERFIGNDIPTSHPRGDEIRRDNAGRDATGG